MDEIEENITTKQISFMKALKAESREEMEAFQEEIATKEILMQQLWTIDGTYFGIGVLNRLKLLQKLIQTDIDSKSLSHNVRRRTTVLIFLLQLCHLSIHVGCTYINLVLLERMERGVGWH